MKREARDRNSLDNETRNVELETATLLTVKHCDRDSESLDGETLS